MVKVLQSHAPSLLAPPVSLYPFTKTDVVQWRNPETTGARAVHWVSVNGPLQTQCFHTEEDQICSKSRSDGKFRRLCRNTIYQWHWCVEMFKPEHHSAPNSHCKLTISCKHALAAFCFPGDHQNNNKSFSNGTCLPVCFPSPGVNPHFSLTYDYRQDAFFKRLITRRGGGVYSHACGQNTDQNRKSCLYFDTYLKIYIYYSYMSLFLAALRSICSSSQLCWFTMATCTQDISSRTAAALPRLTSPLARSGFGFRTTRCVRPACTRSCLPMPTCFSTRGCKGWTSFCTQKNNQQLCVVSGNCDSEAAELLQGTFCSADGEEKMFHFCIRREEEPNPKEYGPAVFYTRFGTCNLLLFNTHFGIWGKKEEHLNTGGTLPQPCKISFIWWHFFQIS